MTPAEWSRLQGFLGDLMRAISAVTALRGGTRAPGHSSRARLSVSSTTVNFWMPLPRGAWTKR